MAEMRPLGRPFKLRHPTTPTREVNVTAVEVAHFDEAWHALGADAKQDPDLTIDLGHVGYLDHECLPFLLGIVSSRVDRRQKTSLRLPKEWRVVEYLRSWRFPEAFDHVSPSTSFVDSLDDNSKSRYVRSTARPPAYDTIITDPKGLAERQLPVSFFELTPVARTGDPHFGAEYYREKFRDKELVEAFNEFLGGLGSRIPDIMIMESVLNILMHGDTQRAFVSAQVMKYSDARRIRRPKELVVSVWDGGDSFGGTIREALDDSRGILSSLYGKDNVTFEFGLSESEGITTRIEEIHSNSVHRTLIEARQTSPDSPLFELLLNIAAFTLGITSEPVRREVYDGTTGRIHEKRPGRGDGLYLLRQNVLHVFGGKISYFYGQWRIHLEARGEGGKIRVAATWLGADGLHLAGKVMALHIPTQDRESLAGQ